MSSNDPWSAPPPNGPPQPGQYPPPGPYAPPPGQYPPPGPYAAPPGQYPPPVAPKKSRSGLWAVVVLIAIIAVAGGGYWLFRDRIAGSASDLRVGDCIDEPAGTTDIREVQHQPCTDPHDGEVFAVVAHAAAAGAPYPLESDFRDLANEQCLPALQSYTGKDLTTLVSTGLDMSAFYPSPDGWDGGSRDVTCYVVKADESKIVGSLRVNAPGATP